MAPEMLGKDPPAWEASCMLVAAVVLALALLVVAVSWGREMDDAAEDTVDADPVSPPKAA
jgi:hypothetical protein